MEPVEKISVEYNGNFYISIWLTNQELEVIDLEMEREEFINLRNDFDKALQESFTKEEEKMTRREAALFLGIQYTKVGQLVKKGILREHRYRFGRKRYFLKNELIKTMEKKGD